MAGITCDLGRSAASHSKPLPPSVERAYYRKCVELKKRINDVEEANDTLRIRRARINRGILKMRLERAFLLEQLEKRMEYNPDGSDKSESPPPTPQDKPLRSKRAHRKSTPPLGGGSVGGGGGGSVAGGTASAHLSPPDNAGQGNVSHAVSSNRSTPDARHANNNNNADYFPSRTQSQSRAKTQGHQTQTQRSSSALNGNALNTGAGSATTSTAAAAAATLSGMYNQPLHFEPREERRASAVSASSFHSHGPMLVHAENGDRRPGEYEASFAREPDRERERERDRGRDRDRERDRDRPSGHRARAREEARAERRVSSDTEMAEEPYAAGRERGGEGEDAMEDGGAGFMAVNR